MRVKTLGDANDSMVFDCPGCLGVHRIPTNKQGSETAWDFNGDLEKPTFAPSLLCRYVGADKTVICHSFIRDGRIEFLGDCTHHLKGQTIDLPTINENDGRLSL